MKEATERNAWSLGEPPVSVILGLPFHDVTFEEAIEECRRLLADSSRTSYLVTANLDFAAQAYEDIDLRKILFYADRVVCDGMPMVWLSRLLGRPLRERVAGSDMVPRLLALCAQEEFPVYFFGSDETTLKECKGLLEQKYEGLQVVGCEAPPMGAVVEWDNDAIARRIRESGARLLLLALGCPKQERWIYAHHQEAGAALSIGIGASLDFITGKQRRAPLWMQKSGTEWIWRMSTDPRRLVARYAKDLVFLVRASLRQLWSLRKRPLRPSLPESGIEELPEEVILLRWVGEIDRGHLERAELPVTLAQPVLCDLSQVTFMDSSGLGCLAQLARNCRNEGQSLALLQPSEVVTRTLVGMKMDSLFEVVASQEEAEALFEDHRMRPTGTNLNASKGRVTVTFGYSLELSTFDDMVETLRRALAENPDLKELVVDLSGVEFIDSRAVGGLIRVNREVVAAGGKLFLSHPRPSVKETLHLLRLEGILPQLPEEKGEAS
ncbi:MAG: WecB/TagA/CpsF family glycosyltransferase [Verrucomicrobiota bacterium]